MFKVIGNRHEGTFATCDDLDAACLIVDSVNYCLNNTTIVDSERHWAYFWVEDENGTEI